MKKKIKELIAIQDEEIDINYRYCTECRVKGSNMDKKELIKRGYILCKSFAHISSI